MGQAPTPISEQFSIEQKDQIKSLWELGQTQQQIADKFGVPRRTIMKLCAHLGLKRTPKEASTIKSPLDKPEIVEKIKTLRNTHSLDEIVEIVGGSVSAVHRLCEKHNIKLDKELFAAIQGERMKAAWTPEKREEISGSKYPQLNDLDWLKEHYIDKDMSMGEIARSIGAPLMSVSHHLRKHGIAVKSKEQVYSKLRRLTAKRPIVKNKWGTFKLQSKAEEEFIASLPDTIKTVEYEEHRFSYSGLHYTPDFCVDGQFVEIKPIGYSKFAGVDRQAFVKQWLIARHNSIEIKLWYKGKYFDLDPVQDIDRYFCLNWKLLFDLEECYKFLANFGFKSLLRNHDYLLIGLNNFFKPTGDDRLNANFPNSHAIEFMRHFNPHYWSSHHIKYIPLKAAFEEGNRTVLRNALGILWKQKRNINIYGLVRVIARRFKDFKFVSVFKPWVARYIYDELLPNGGVIVDPCMGWGGRFLGTLDGRWKYIGFDLNSKAVEAHENMRRFIGARITEDPSFSVADASNIQWPKGDLLFTSPPYDDLEYYDGLEKQCEDTTPIYENIMRFDGLIALNVPKKHRDKCIFIAESNSRKLIKEYKMKTASLAGMREKTYEPILIFK